MNKYEETLRTLTTYKANIQKALDSDDVSELEYLTLNDMMSKVDEALAKFSK